MTKIDSYLAGYDEASMATRRTDAANQRDNWLRQMELAQLGQMGAAPARRTSAPAPFIASPAAHRMPQASQQGPHRHTAGASGNGAGASAAASPDAAHEQAARPDEHNSGSKAAGTGAAQADAPGAADVPVVVNDALHGAANAAPAGLAVAGGPIAAAAGPSSEPAAVARVSSPVAAPTARMPVAVPSTQRALASARPDTPEAGGEATAADQPDWQKSMMHLTGDGDDVQLWIRDSELTAAQSQQLVARLAGDVAGMGMRLKGATVNGKPALRAATRDDAAAAEADEPQYTINPTTEQQHVSR